MSLSFAWGVMTLFVHVACHDSYWNDCCCRSWSGKGSPDPALSSENPHVGRLCWRLTALGILICFFVCCPCGHSHSSLSVDDELDNGSGCVSGSPWSSPGCNPGRPDEVFCIAAGGCQSCCCPRLCGQCLTGHHSTL